MLVQIYYAYHCLQPCGLVVHGCSRRRSMRRMRADAIRVDGHEPRRRHHARRVARLRPRVSKPGLERRRTALRARSQHRRTARTRTSKRPTTCRTGTSATSAGRRPASTTSTTTAIAESARTSGISTSRRSAASIAIATARSIRPSFSAANVDDARDASFDDLDWNNNGRVERSEWYGSPAVFTSLDRNRDGVLSRFEVVGGVDTPNDTWDRVRLARLQPQRLDQPRRMALVGRVVQPPRHEPRRHALAAGIRSRRRQRRHAAPSGRRVLQQRTVRVNSQQRWTDSGIVVRAGDTVTLDASGNIQMSDDAKRHGESGGIDDGPPRARCACAESARRRADRSDRQLRPDLRGRPPHVYGAGQRAVCISASTTITSPTTEASSSSTSASHGDGRASASNARPGRLGR